MAHYRKQHVTPRMHLQRFVGSNPDGHVWCYDKSSHTERSAIPTELGTESHFYSVELPDGTMDTSIEKAIGDIESDASKPYEKLLNGEMLDKAEKYAFAAFLALMYLRTPAMRNAVAEAQADLVHQVSYTRAMDKDGFNKTLDEIAAENGEDLSPEIRESLRQALIDPSDYKIKIHGGSTMHVFSALQELTDRIAGMNWCLVIPARDYFVTSDNPVLRRVAAGSYDPLYGNGGFDNKTVRVTMALAPSCGVVCTWMPINAKATASRESVHELNKALIGSAERFVYSHIKEKWIGAIANKMHGQPTKRFVVDGPSDSSFGTVEVARRGFGYPKSEKN